MSCSRILQMSAISLLKSNCREQMRAGSAVGGAAPQFDSVLIPLPLPPSPILNSISIRLTGFRLARVTSAPNVIVLPENPFPTAPDHLCFEVAPNPRGDIAKIVRSAFVGSTICFAAPRILICITALGGGNPRMCISSATLLSGTYLRILMLHVF